MWSKRGSARAWADEDRWMSGQVESKVAVARSLPEASELRSFQL